MLKNNLSNQFKKKLINQLKTGKKKKMLRANVTKRFCSLTEIFIFVNIRNCVICGLN